MNESNIKQRLRDIISEYEFKGDNMDFFIQYSVFDIQKEYCNKDYDICELCDYDREGGHDECYIYCPLKQCLGEGLYEFDVIESDVTDINFTSCKFGHQNFTLESLSDFRGKSNDRHIYACDLYPDFKPKHFKGNCMTLCWFRPWNWHYLESGKMRDKDNPRKIHS